jgi:hypothetical protein
VKPRGLLLLAAGFLFCLTPAPAAAPVSKTIGTRGEVVSISADGPRVAIHARLGGDDEPCNSAAVWTPATGRLVRLQDAPCEPNASQEQFAALALAGSRVAWVDYDYGNHAYCSGPYTATIARPQAVDLARCSPDEADVYWQFAGDAALLVGRSFLLCDFDCEKDYDRRFDTDVTIWRVADGLATIRAAEDDTRLLDVAEGRILLLASGALVVASPGGKTVGEIPAENVDSARFSGQTIVAASGRALSVYSPSGEREHVWTMATGGRLRDAEGGVALYTTGPSIHLLRLSDGRDRVLRAVRGLVDAELEPPGLFYAFDKPGGGVKPGRVTFVPAAALPD